MDSGPAETACTARSAAEMTAATDETARRGPTGGARNERARRHT